MIEALWGVGGSILTALVIFLFSRVSARLKKRVRVTNPIEEAIRTIAGATNYQTRISKLLLDGYCTHSWALEALLEHAVGTANGTLGKALEMVRSGREQYDKFCKEAAMPEEVAVEVKS